MPRNDHPAIDRATRGERFDVSAITDELEGMSVTELREAYWGMDDYSIKVDAYLHNGQVRALIYGELRRRNALGNHGRRPPDDPPRRVRR